MNRIGWTLAPSDKAKIGRNPLLKWLSKAAHLLLYTLMLVVPVVGIPTLLYRGRGINFDVFSISQLLPRAPEIFKPLTELHELSAYALILLCVGHVVAALYHQIILRDRLVWRMLPEAVGRAE